MYKNKPAHFSGTKISGRGAAKMGAMRKIDAKRFPYEILENEFHGGGHIAYATRYDLALKHVQKYIEEDIEFFNCHCGGPIVVRTDGQPLKEGLYVRSGV